MSLETSKRLFTVEEYHSMADAGILSEGDRVELIDGEVLRMSAFGPRHMACTDRGTRLMIETLGRSVIVRVQGSVRLNQYNEPEPDLLLLQPRDDFYASRFAGPGDVFLAMEVAETSASFDRNVKARLYSEAGILEYWLLDLNRDVLEVRRNPSASGYLEVTEYHRGESVALLAFPESPIRVDDLLG